MSIVNVPRTVTAKVSAGTSGSLSGRQQFVLLVSMILLFAFSNQVRASGDDGQQFQRLGDWEVHYSAFPSTFLLPEVAQLYQINRSNSQAVLNISVLDATDPERPAQRVQVTGFAVNDIGQRRELTFRRHIDGDAIYYLAQVPHGDDERLRFTIRLRRGNDEQQLTFRQRFYRG